MASNYTGNPFAAQAPASVPSPGVAPILSLIQDADGNTSANLYQAWKVLADYVAYLMRSAAGAAFGDGLDGTLTFDGAATVLGLVPSAGKYTMNRDIYAGAGNNDLIVTGAGTQLATNGYRIFCRGSVRTLLGGIITANGASAVGATQGAELAFGSIATGSAGGAGGTSTVGAQGVDRAYSSLGAITNAGSGGLGSAGAGGRGALATLGDMAFMPGRRLYTPHLFGMLAGAGFSTPYASNTGVIAPVYSGLGGGGGGFGGGNGGGGGAGGGLLCIAASRVILANGTDLQVLGGNGGNAAGTNAGGGGGGSGGAIMIAVPGVLEVTGTAFSTATSCTGGTGGTKNGTGVAGTNGTTGAFFTVVLG